jgi:hypothetical protein
MSRCPSTPVCQLAFDQEFLDFLAAVVKATRVVELKKEPNAMDRDYSGIKDFGRKLSMATKDRVKKAVTDAKPAKTLPIDWVSGAEIW